MSGPQPLCRIWLATIRKHHEGRYGSETLQQQGENQPSKQLGILPKTTIWKNLLGRISFIFSKHLKQLQAYWYWYIWYFARFKLQLSTLPPVHCEEVWHGPPCQHTIQNTFLLLEVFHWKTFGSRKTGSEGGLKVDPKVAFHGKKSPTKQIQCGFGPVVSKRSSLKTYLAIKFCSIFFQSFGVKFFEKSLWNLPPK